MIERLTQSIVLQPLDIAPSKDGWEVVGVFNPAVAIVDGKLVMLARIAERPLQSRPGWTPLPRWQGDGESVVDWMRDDELVPVDSRVVAMKATGDLRLTSVSYLNVLRQSSADDNVWETVGVVLPQGPSEEFGIEDARVTKIDDNYWVTYVAVSRSGAATALMSSTDLVTFKRHGVIFPSENKDVVLFPQRIAGEYVALHRPNPNSHFSPPQIWIARSPDLIHWGQHESIVAGCEGWEADRVGSGTPPILINEGWLTLYHGSERSTVQGHVGRYAAGALLLDREDPTRVIARSCQPVMLPKTDYEKCGFVPNVVFPTAMLALGNNLQVFYGAADTCVAMVTFSKRSLLDSLTSQGT